MTAPRRVNAALTDARSHQPRRLAALPGRRRWLQGLAGLSAGWATGAWSAQAGVDAPPEPSPPRPLQVPAMVRHALANGLTVVTVPRHNVPLVSATLMLRAGAELDPRGRAGTAALTANLLGKGLRRGRREVSATEVAREAESLGSVLLTDSHWRSISLGMTVTPHRLGAALGLMADALQHPLLATDELERARAQAIDGARLAQGVPAEVATLALRRAFWGDSAYGAVTPAAAWQRLNLADVQAFHALHARPDRVVLVLAGDVQPERAALLAQLLLGEWPHPGTLASQAIDGQARPLAAPAVLVDMPGSGQSTVALAAPFPPSSAPDRVVGLVADAVLGGGYSARLNQSVRIQRGLSYGAFSSVEAYPAGGMLSARAQTRHATAAQVLSLMRDEMQRLRLAAPVPEELAARQATLVGSFARSLQTTAGLARLAAAQLSNGRTLQALQRHAAEVMAVTPQQVRDFAATYWAPERLRAVVAGDLSAAGPGLAAAAQPDAVRLSQGALDLEKLGLRTAEPAAATATTG